MVQAHIPCALCTHTMNANFTLPEYLHIFGEEGPVALEVHGPTGPLALPARRICAEDIAWLVSLDGQLIRNAMSFDGQVMEIVRCTLDPVKQHIRLDVQ